MRYPFQINVHAPTGKYVFEGWYSTVADAAFGALRQVQYERHWANEEPIESYDSKTTIEVIQQAAKGSHRSTPGLRRVL